MPASQACSLNARAKITGETENAIVFAAAVARRLTWALCGKAKLGCILIKEHSESTVDMTATGVGSRVTEEQSNSLEPSSVK